MTVDRLQAKHIPDVVFTDAVRIAQLAQGNPVTQLRPMFALMGGSSVLADFFSTPPRGGWSVSRFDVGAVLNWVIRERGGDIEIPQKVLLAKARRLESRWLLDGCTCGCSGGWRVSVEPDFVSYWSNGSLTTREEYEDDAVRWASRQPKPAFDPGAAMVPPFLWSGTFRSWPNGYRTDGALRAVPAPPGARP
ncbi:hypothetical protein [Frankia sp. AgW1.1]|uniref:hypothetical protein n=1 Tax=Frankia sp. AgW1.1 TaxID=1836971 RepID=UPI0019334D06|nr:hypothetical protein [Frankia sp. AgW1.1]MBL7487123.1 hypothetical protein [Frankia sp. AgW1.1]